MSEKRTRPRFDVCLDVRCQASSTHYNVRIADISEGGCYVDTILEVIKGETLLLKILMPDGGWLEIDGIVAHHYPRLGFGVCFADPDDEQRRLIQSLIDWVNPKQEKQTEACWPIKQIDVSCHELM